MKYIPFILLLLLTSCYDEIDLSKYGRQEGLDKLTLNAVVNEDSTIKVFASRPFYYTSNHTKPDVVENLSINLIVNGNKMGMMTYNKDTQRYESNVKPKQGDRIQLQTSYNGQLVQVEDSVPEVVKIEKVTASRQGPMHIYEDYDYRVNYHITFTDKAGEANYYFLRYDAYTPDTLSPNKWNLYMGECNYEREFVFTQLANQVNATIPGWEPYSPYGLPFSDYGIDGKTYTLNVGEIIQNSSEDSGPYADCMFRKFTLYSISKAYYNFLVSQLGTKMSSGIQGGLIDVGLVEPQRYYSNVEGGLGIMGCYTENSIIINVFTQTGDFSRK